MDEPRGPAITLFSKGAPGRVSYPIEKEREREMGLTISEAYALELEGVFDDGKFLPADGHEIHGVVISLVHVGRDGKESRLPNSAKIEALLDSAMPRAAVISWTKVNGAEMVFLIANGIDRSRAGELFAAAKRIVEAWIEEYDLQPEEFAPGMWRGGLVVEHRDPLAPVPTPRAVVAGVRRVATLVIRKMDDLPTADTLISRAAKLVVTEIAVPPVTDQARPKGGLIRQVMQLGRK